MSTTQNVYFTTPAVIQQAQNSAGLNARMDEAKTLLGIQSYFCGGPANIPYSGCPAVLATGQAITGPTSLNTAFNLALVGTGANADGFGQNNKGLICVIGNAFSNQEVVFTTGVATYFGTGYSYDQTLMSVASVGKFVNSFTFLQMLERRMILGSDTMYTLTNEPTWTGTYWYYTSGTGGLMSNDAIATGVANFTAGGNVGGYDWTGTRASGNLNEFTLANCASLNIGFPHVYTLAPGNGIGNWLLTGASQAGADWAMNNAIKDYYNAQKAGIAAGSPTVAMSNPLAVWDGLIARIAGNFTFITGPNTDYINNSIKVIKNGVCPLGYRVAAMTGTTIGLKINTERATYGQFNYQLIGKMCSLAAVRAGYSSLLDYVTQNVFQPLEIETPRDMFLQAISTPPTDPDRFRCGQLCRRTKLMSSGTNVGGIGISYDLYQAGLDWEANPATGKKWNTLYWSPEEYQDELPGVGFTAFPNETFWSFSSGIVSNAKSLVKLYKTYINKGVYTKSNGTNVQLIKRRTWNYSQSTCVAPGAQWYQYAEIPQYFNTGNRWVMGQFQMIDGANPYGDITFSSADWGGLSGTTNISPYTLNSLGTWGGANGGHFCFDWTTGYYVFIWHAVYNGESAAKALSSSALLPFICETIN